MTDLSPEARALLRGARDDLGASKEDCARIDRALTARLGLAAGAIAGATTATSASAAAAGGAGVGLGGVGVTTALITGKWIAGALVVGAVGVGSGAVYLASGPSVSRTTPSASAPAPSAHVATATPLASSSSSATVEPPERGAPRPEPAAASSGTVRTDRGRVQAALALPNAPEQSASIARAMVAVTPTIGAETQLLRRADQALRNGDPPRALDLLDEHARTFPNGVLAEERSAERVTTLCALGRVSEARTEAARFLAANGESPLADAVRRSCGGKDEGGNPAPVP